MMIYVNILYMVHKDIIAKTVFQCKWIKLANDIATETQNNYLHKDEEVSIKGIYPLTKQF